MRSWTDRLELALVVSGQILCCVDEGPLELGEIQRDLCR